MKLSLWPERLLIAASALAAGFALLQLVNGARTADRDFESHLAEGRYYSQVARNFAKPETCASALADILPSWNRQQPIANLHLKADLPNWSGAGEASLSLVPTGATTADLWVEAGKMRRRVPLDLSKGCEIDRRASPGEWGSGWALGTDCTEPYTYGRFYRCPQGHFLNRQLYPYEVKCCPFKS